MFNTLGTHPAGPAFPLVWLASTHSKHIWFPSPLSTCAPVTCPKEVVHKEYYTWFMAEDNDDTDHCFVCLQDVEDPHDPLKGNACSLCCNTLVCTDCEFVVSDLADLNDVTLIDDDPRIADFQSWGEIVLDVRGASSPMH